MDKEQRIAFINSQIVCCNAELVAMQLQNKIDEQAGRPLTNSPKNFSDLPIYFQLGHNQVISYLLEQ